jgi:hypothetical protein
VIVRGPGPQIVGRKVPVGPPLLRVGASYTPAILGAGIFGSEIQPEPKKATRGDFRCKASAGDTGSIALSLILLRSMFSPKFASAGREYQALASPSSSKA